jgi:HSP20 family protein
MSNLSRWEPEREVVTLRDAMDRLFDDAFTRPFGFSGRSFVPAIDLYQTNDEVVVKAALPGFKAEDVQITVTDNVLTLRSQFQGKNGNDNGNGNGNKEFTYHLREHRFGAFERLIPLPVDVESNKAQAEFENGILTIRLPKAEAVRPKTIRIQTK